MNSWVERRKANYFFATAVERLLLDSNFLTGTIPPEWGGMTNLESLVVHSNRLTGVVPTTVGSLSSLRELWLNNNLLEGNVPTQLGSCPALSVVQLQDNVGIGGRLPAELGNLKSLGELENECVSRRLLGFCI